MNTNQIKELLENIINEQIATYDVEYTEAIDNMIDDLNALKDKCIPATNTLIEHQIYWLNEMYHEWLNEKVYNTYIFRKCYIMINNLKEYVAVMSMGAYSIQSSNSKMGQLSARRMIESYYEEHTNRQFEFDEVDYNESLKLGKVDKPISLDLNKQEEDVINDSPFDDPIFDIDGLEPLNTESETTFEKYFAKVEDYDTTLVECDTNIIEYVIGHLRFATGQEDGIVTVNVYDAPLNDEDEDVMRYYDGDKSIKYNVHGKLKSGFASQWFEFMLQKLDYTPEYIEVACDTLQEACKQLENNYFNN